MNKPIRFFGIKPDDYKKVSTFRIDVVGSVTQTINTIFSKYSIDFEPRFSKDRSHMTFVCNCKDNKSIIITIYLNPDDNKPIYIYVDYLVSCKVNDTEINGGNILTKIIELKNEIRVNFINLRDVSYKIINKCRLNLSIFEIITNDECLSWYNRYGFFSHNHKDDVDKNQETCIMTFHQLIESLRSPVHQIKVLNFQKKYVIASQTSIRGYFSSVKRYLKTHQQVDCDFINDLNDLMDVLVNSGKIQYDNDLYYKNGSPEDNDEIQLFIE